MKRSDPLYHKAGVALTVALCCVVAGGQEPGEDIELGHSLVFRLEGEGDAQLSARAIEVLKHRIDPDGLKDIEFVPLDSGLVEIRLPPGGMEPAELKSLIALAGGTPEFRVAPCVPEMRPPSELKPLIDVDQRNRYVDALGKGRVSVDDGGGAFKWFEVHGAIDEYRAQGLIAAEGPDGRGYILLCDHRDLCMTHDRPGHHDWTIIEAEPTIDQQGSLAIRIWLDEAGGAQMRRLSQANLQRSLAIVLGGTVYSAPRLAGPVGQDIQITGRFTAEEVTVLVRVLQAGTLPFRIDLEPVVHSRFEFRGSLSPRGSETASADSGWLVILGLIAAGVVVLALLGYCLPRLRRGAGRSGR
jgi:hypothetical protein